MDWETLMIHQARLADTGEVIHIAEAQKDWPRLRQRGATCVYCGGRLRWHGGMIQSHWEHLGPNCHRNRPVAS